MTNSIVTAAHFIRHLDFVIRPLLNGECRIRTCEGISHQIYSLTRLTASVTPRVQRISCDPSATNSANSAQPRASDK